MKVIEVWAMDCPTCQKFEDNHVFEYIRDVVGPLTDIWWIPRRIDEVGSPTLGYDDGDSDDVFDKSQVYGSSTSDIIDLYEDSVKTPGLFLDDDHGDGFVELDPADLAGAKDSDILERNPKLAARRIMKRIFRFYLKYPLGLPYEIRRRFLPVYSDEDEEFVNVRPDNPRAARRNPDLVYPQYDQNRFKVNDWREAFLRVKEFQRDYAKKTKY
jgi:hypothetical protein